MSLKQVLIVRNDLKMGKGKIAAQSAHASIQAFLNAQNKNTEVCDNWIRSGMPKIVLKVQSEKELLDLFELLKKHSLRPALIQDAGRTQVAPGSFTCVGVGPALERDLDSLTGKLKLL